MVDEQYASAGPRMVADHGGSCSESVSGLAYVRDDAAVRGRGLVKPLGYRASGRRIAGTDCSVLVVPHGTRSVDGRQAAVPVQRPEVRERGRLRGGEGTELDRPALPAGHQTPRTHSRGRNYVLAADLQPRGGRDPELSVDGGGFGQPAGHGLRQTKWIRVRVYRSGVRGQRPCAVDSHRARVGALPVTTQQSDPQRQVRGARAMSGAIDRGLLGHAAVWLEHSGTHAMRGRLGRGHHAAVHAVVRG